MEFWLRYDLRRPSFASACTADLIDEALKQVEWADSLGFHTVQLSEHHGAPDGYNPSPLILGAAVAARTKKLRINPPLIITLHDPVRLAEDCCILDQISRGRLDVTIAIGYVPHEFAMFGVPLEHRGQIAEEKLTVIKTIFSGKDFDYHGRCGRVTPAPYQVGGPKIYVGGSVKASARRAAKFGDGFYPMNASLFQEYRLACERMGKPEGKTLLFSAPVFFHISEDPDAAWDKIAPHAMHEANSYAAMAAITGLVSPFPAAMTSDELRATGAYEVMTPDECISYCRAAHVEGHNLIFSPMMGGLSPDFAWESLELFASQVLPALFDEGLVTTP